MKFTYTQPTHSPESLGNTQSNPNTLLGHLDALPGGKSLDIDLSTERPITFEPRFMPVTDLKILSPESEPFIQNQLIPLITSGKEDPSKFRYLRQNFDGRSRSLELENTETGNWISISGIGLMVDRQVKGEGREYHIHKPVNDITLREMDYHNLGPESYKIGNATYHEDGSLEFTGGHDPAGGYIYEVLQNKIDKTLIAGTILQDKTITPKWLMSARLDGELTGDGKSMGVGAYELPPNLLEFHLAEISEYLKLNGVENTIYEKFIFNANRALLALGEQDYVHGQPHMGNILASLNDDFKPIFKDFTTLTDISNFPKTPLEKLGNYSPYIINLMQDVSILNMGLLRSYTQIRDFTRFPCKEKALNLLPQNYKKPVIGPEYYYFLAEKMAWATAGRLAPNGTYPSKGTIEKYTEMILPKVNNAYRTILKSSNPDENLDSLVQLMLGGLVVGTNPVTEYDKLAAQFVDNLRANYKAQDVKKRR